MTLGKENWDSETGALFGSSLSHDDAALNGITAASVELLTQYPLSLCAIARVRRVYPRTMTECFGLSRQIQVLGVVLFRDLLCSRAIEQGLVARGWFPASAEPREWLREISLKISAPWQSLLSPREREELKHVHHVLSRMSDNYRAQPLRKED